MKDKCFHCASSSLWSSLFKFMVIISCLVIGNKEIVYSSPNPELILNNSTTCLESKSANIKVLGNTILADALIKEIIESHQKENLKICFSDLTVIAEALTEEYIKQGYVTSVVIVPEQLNTESGIVLRAIEGKLERIEINGLKRVQERYVRSRINRFVGEVVNIREIEQALQFLATNPLFKNIGGELKSGSTPINTVLVINLEESASFRVEGGFDNYQSPLIGELQWNVGTRLLNVSGYGDSLGIKFEFSEGSEKIITNYFVPINALDGGLSLSYQGSKSRIILPELSEADIRFLANSYSIGWIQPVINNAKENLSLGLTLDIRDNRSFIFKDEPFSISQAAVDGVTKFRVFRLSTDYLRQSEIDFFLVRSRVNFGIEGFDATLAEGFNPGSIYWFGQAQYARRIRKRIIFATKFGFQLSASPLPPIEQFEIGGPLTVRGYARATRLGDNGFFLSNELQISILANGKFGTLQIVPFVDFGTVWQSGENRNRFDEGSLASVGLGLRYYYKDFVIVRLDYGFALNDIEQEGKGLSNNGFNFAVYVVPLRF